MCRVFDHPLGVCHLIHDPLTLQLSIRINELENKRQFKCIWVNSKYKEEKELVLYPNKNGTVTDLLDEARKQVDLAENGTGKLRCALARPCVTHFCVFCLACGYDVAFGYSVETTQLTF